MKKISWCKNQEKGIKLIEPNDDISEEYFQSADGKTWTDFPIS